MKTKMTSSKPFGGAKGGSTGMFGKSGVAPREPGVSAPTKQQPFDKGMLKGGKGKMAGKSGAAPSEAGKTSTGGRSGNNKFAPDTGGSGRMAGKTGSSPAQKR